MGEKKKENIGIVDEIEWVHRDKHGNVIRRYSSKGKKHKCLTNLGFKEIAGLMLTDVGGTAFDYIAIGTGTTAADPTDTALQTEVKRKAGTGTRVTTTVTDDTAQLVTTFSSADTLSGTQNITEVGVFNAAAAGVMLMRQVFTAESINWDAGDTFEITVKVQCKQGA